MRRLASLAWIVAVLTAVTACSTGLEGTAPRSTPSLGAEVFPAGERSPAPHLRGTTLTGEALDLADELGHGPVVVNVWASWCGPCRREMPLLAHTGTRIRVIGIDERDDPRSARDFAASRGATYPSLSDPDGTLLARLAVLPQYGVPSTLFLDDRGRVAARVVGPIRADVLRRVLDLVEGVP